MFQHTHAGICSICFEPVRKGDQFRYRYGGRTFHLDCAKSNPNSYYAKLERRRAFRQGNKHRGFTGECETALD